MRFLLFILIFITFETFGKEVKETEITTEGGIEVYKKETDPLINLYKDKNLIYLNGDGEEEEIFNELRKKLDPFTE